MNKKRWSVFSLLKRVLSISGKNNLVRFLAITAIMVISAGLSQVMPLAIGKIADLLIATNQLAFTLVVPYLLVILIAIVTNELIKIARRLIVEDLATRTEKKARQVAVESLLKAPLAYFRQNMTGNIHGRLNRSLEGTSGLLKLVFMDFAPSVVAAVAAIIVIFITLPILIALVSVLVIPMGVLIVWQQIKTQKGIRVALFDSKAQMDGVIVELLGGIETIRVADGTDFESERFAQKSELLRAKEMKHHYAMAGYDAAKFLNEAVFNVLIIGLSVWLATQNVISVGAILTAYLCFTQLTTPLRELHRILDELAEKTVQAREYFKLTDLPLDFSYAKTKPRAKLATGGVASGVKVSKLFFAYPENPQDQILTNISLDINPGEYLGIAGHSGGGKSSFIKLLAKLEPYRGTIAYHSEDLASLSRANLASKIALVPQKPFIIADTIFNNICYGCKEAVTLEQVKQAAQLAYLSHDIEKLPRGYDFEVSEGGTNLSGGQRQRLALARIFLRKPEIIILDEATSALDNVSEKIVQENLEKLNREEKITIIAIAHRLTTLKNCHRIIVFASGRIVQDGSYEQLTKQDGIFRKMALGLTD